MAIERHNVKYNDYVYYVISSQPFPPPVGQPASAKRLSPGRPFPIPRARKGAGESRRHMFPWRKSLRQVVAERGKEHAVVGGRIQPTPAPGVADHVGVLRSELDAALGSDVDAVPETERAFDDGPGIAGALGQAAGIESAR